MRRKRQLEATECRYCINVYSARFMRITFKKYEKCVFWPDTVCWSYSNLLNQGTNLLNFFGLLILIIESFLKCYLGHLLHRCIATGVKNKVI